MHRCSLRVVLSHYLISDQKRSYIRQGYIRRWDGIIYYRFNYVTDVICTIGQRLSFS